jgi:hypothetical protein
MVTREENAKAEGNKLGSEPRPPFPFGGLAGLVVLGLFLSIFFCPHSTMAVMGGPYRTAVAQVAACPRARAALGEDIHLGWFGFCYGSNHGSSGGFRVPVVGSRASGDLSFSFNGSAVSWSLVVPGGEADLDSKSCK